MKMIRCIGLRVREEDQDQRLLSRELVGWITPRRAVWRRRFLILISTRILPSRPLRRAMGIGTEMYIPILLFTLSRSRSHRNQKANHSQRLPYPNPICSLLALHLDLGCLIGYRVQRLRLLQSHTPILLLPSLLRSIHRQLTVLLHLHLPRLPQ